MSIRAVTTTLWLTGGIGILLALIAWATNRLDDGTATLYELFPLLGLVAFTLMWTHYIGGSLLRLSGTLDESARLKPYYRSTGWIVLACILLHPGILIYALWLDGFGLPPASYLSVYTTQAQTFAIMLGSLALIAFMLFEFKRKFGAKSWWRFVEWFNVFAMYAIVIHGLTLGGELDSWYRIVWIFYVLTLTVSLIYNFVYDRRLHARTIKPKA